LIYFVTIINCPPNFSFGIAGKKARSGANILVPHFAVAWITEGGCINVHILLFFAFVAVVGEVASMGVAVENAALARLSFLFRSSSTTSTAATRAVLGGELS
jgi:hypothetical protein